MSPEPQVFIDAGAFSPWLAAMRAVLRGERDADVPCGDCVGCCVSSYPIPLRPEDVVARERVPEQLLLGPAPPGERWLMGFRHDGTCPFMEAKRCAIYTGRPQTCRDYDCRIYAAAGLLPDGDRPLIQQRVLSWRFGLESDEDRIAANSVRLAAQFIVHHASLFPPAVRAGSATAAAVLAVKTYEVFAPAEQGAAAENTGRMVERVMAAAQAFDANTQN